MKYSIFALLLVLLLSLYSCENDSSDSKQLTITIENQSVTISTDSLDTSNSPNLTSTTQVVPIELFESEIDYDGITIFTEKAVKLSGLIYIPVLCKGLYDEYVYNIDTDSGSYMSGVKSLGDEYGELIELIKESNYPYFLDCLVSINQDKSAAVLRRSKRDDYSDGKYLSGEYYLLDFETNATMNICDSYPGCVDTIPGTRIEDITWESNDSVRITTYNSSGEFCTYSASRAEDGWVVSTEE